MCAQNNCASSFAFFSINDFSINNRRSRSRRSQHGEQCGGFVGTTNPVDSVKRGHGKVVLCPLLQLQELTSRPSIRASGARQRHGVRDARVEPHKDVMLTNRSVQGSGSPPIPNGTPGATRNGDPWLAPRFPVMSSTWVGIRQVLGLPTTTKVASTRERHPVPLLLAAAALLPLPPPCNYAVL